MKSSGGYGKHSQWKDVFRRFCKNRAAIVGLVTIFILILLAIFADIIAPLGYDNQNLSEALTKPGKKYLLGTDNFGRDILSRLIYGARVSLRVGIISVSIAALIGGILGTIAAYYGYVTDSVVMRIMDVLMATPGILLAISIAAALGPGLTNLMIALGISSAPGYARIVRASVMSVKEQEFIEAARSIGANNLRIILRHIVPNVLAPVIVQATLGVASAILVAASMSFIGLGIQPPVPEWGAMLSAARPFMRDYPHIIMSPGITIMITILALNLVGDGLRDALDPRMKK
jgi:peptide/nickel transport system permease protein